MLEVQSSAQLSIKAPKTKKEQLEEASKQRQRENDTIEWELEAPVKVSESKETKALKCCVQKYQKNGGLYVAANQLKHSLSFVPPFLFPVLIVYFWW